MRIKAAPPFWPVINGNRHIFPNPTADPAVAKTIASLLPNVPLLLMLYQSELMQEDEKDADRTYILHQKKIEMEKCPIA